MATSKFDQQISSIIASLEGSLLGCPCTYNFFYKEFFLDWMGFDREAKRHFLAAFSDEPGLFCGNLYLRRCYDIRESVVY